MAGSILIQTEAHGEAWYVDPVSLTRLYLGRPTDAFAIMRELGLGISNSDLSRVGVDAAFTRRLAGRILLQVESRGEAWYVDPLELQGHYLGRPTDAFNLMRRFGLGISDRDLAQIPAGAPLPAPAAGPESDRVTSAAPIDLAKVEFLAQELVNQERVNAGLKALADNRELAAVARGHSRALAEENGRLTGLGRACDYPLIHHEGLAGAAYNSDRLKAGGVSYFNKSGENIALVSAVSVTVRLRAGDPAEGELGSCEGDRQGLDRAFRDRLERLASAEDKLAAVRSEVGERERRFADARPVTVAGEEWHGALRVAQESVAGWMASPGHRRNILDPDFNEAGLGAAYVNGYAILTQAFIRRAACGYEGGPCCVETGFYPYCFSPLSCRNQVCGG